MRLMSWSVFLAMVILALAPARAARAQAAIDFEDAFTADITRADMPTIRAALLLDADQASIVEALIHDYQQQFMAALQLVREDLRDAQAAMGVEDPETDAQREALREEIAMVFEAMQQELQELPEGSSPEELRAKYEHQIQRMQERLKQLSPPPVKPEEVAQIFDAASRRLEAWRAEKKKVRARFVADTQAILRPEQIERWPALDRTLLRQHAIGRARLQGEGVDVTLLARPIKDGSPAVAEQVAAYEMAIDAALRARIDMIESSERSIFNAVRNNDRASLLRAVERITQARVAVRNVNDDAAASIANALPAEGERSGAWFIESYRQRAYPMVFRDTQAQRLLKAATEMTGLSADQQRSIADLLAAYEKELGPMNEQVLAALRQGEPGQYTVREVHRLLPPSADDEAAERERGTDSVQQAFALRVEMGRRFDQQLQAIIGAEAYERLPRNTRPAGGVETPDEVDKEDAG